MIMMVDVEKLKAKTAASKPKANVNTHLYSVFSSIYSTQGGSSS